MYLPKDIYQNVHRTFFILIPNQKPPNAHQQWTEQINIAISYNRVHTAMKIETRTTHNNIDESHKYSIEQKKPDTKEYM